MAVGLVTVPRVLREKLGDDGADALVEFLNSAQVVQKAGLDLFGERLENRLVQLQREIAEDLNRLRQDVDNKLDGLRRDVDQKLNGLRQDVENKLDGLRQDVDQKLGELRQDVDQKLDGLRSFTLGVVGVGVALISLVVVLAQWVR